MGLEERNALPPAAPQLTNGRLRLRALERYLEPDSRRVQITDADRGPEQGKNPLRHRRAQSQVASWGAHFGDREQIEELRQFGFRDRLPSALYPDRDPVGSGTLSDAHGLTLC